MPKHANRSNPRRVRLYHPFPINKESIIILTAEQEHYLRRVLRLRSGNRVRLFNAEDGEWETQIIDGAQTKLRVLTKIKNHAESPLRIHLGQAIIRGKRMGYTIQKATELGLAALTPLLSARSQFQTNKQNLARKVAHWQTIAEQSARQCLRTNPPHVHAPCRLEDWLASLACPLRIVMHESALPSQPLSTFLNASRRAGTLDTQSLVLLVGPEGGFSAAEIELILQQGFHPWVLGPRLLRAETAAPAALAILQFLVGDLNETNA